MATWPRPNLLRPKLVHALKDSRYVAWIWHLAGTCIFFVLYQGGCACLFSHGVCGVSYMLLRGNQISLEDTIAFDYHALTPPDCVRSPRYLYTALQRTSV